MRSPMHITMRITTRRLPAAAVLLLATVTSTRALAAQSPRVVTVRGEATGMAGRQSTAATAGARRASPPAEIVLQRESFVYSGDGRRDPYQSLMSSSDVRPLLSDLRLTAVAFDPAGNNSVAILRDAHSRTQYRVRVGQQLGRLRVSAIRQKAVQFAIEEFGFNRQETLPLSSDTTKVRKP
jgi:hypothetical protein